jgi:hypothetical protein
MAAMTKQQAEAEAEAARQNPGRPQNTGSGRRQLFRKARELVDRASVRRAKSCCLLQLITSAQKHCSGFGSNRAHTHTHQNHPPFSPRNERMNQKSGKISQKGYTNRQV